MADFQEDIEEFAQVVDALYGGTVHDSDAGRALEAAANLHSGSGYLNGRPELVAALLAALATGYGAALLDLRKGALDDEVLASCSALLERYADELASAADTSGVQ